MRFKSLSLIASIVALIACILTLPSWAQDSTPAKQPWLAGGRFTVAAGLGQQYQADDTHSLTNTVPRNVGWAAADYEITPAFAVTASWKRSINGVRFDQGFIGVGFRLPFGGYAR